MAVTLQDKLAKLGPERRERVERRAAELARRSPGMKKPWPLMRTDEEAERFVAEADLTEHDFSALVPVRFALRRKDEAVSLRPPEALLGAVKRTAARQAIPHQRFIQQAIEPAVVAAGAAQR